MHGPGRIPHGQPLVTVITPTYNRAPFLRETLNSVLDQKYPALEYLVVDDGSTDETATLLEEYRDHIQVLSHPNMGEVRTVNRGLSMATGEFILIVNSDDPLRPGALAALSAALSASPEAVVAYSDWDEIDPHSQWVRTHRLTHYTLDTLLLNVCIPIGPGTMFRRSTLETVGQREPRRRFTADLDHWLRLAEHGPFVHVPVPLATHRTHPDSTLVRSYGRQLAWEVSRLGYDALERPTLPAALAARRFHILTRAHRVALHYCGHDLGAWAYHAMRLAALFPRAAAERLARRWWP